MDSIEQEESSVLFVVFKIKDGLYCTNSKYIETLVQVPEFVKLPQSSPAVAGIFPYRDDFVTMFDLRTAFGLKNLSEEYDAFADMLDQRRDDHIQWVAALEHSIVTGEEFTLSHDPHACAFGKWYDNFQSDNYTISHHLKKIEEPHIRLHEAADRIDACRKICDSEERLKQMKEILRNVKELYMPAIIHLLEDTKDIFHLTMFHEMALVLSNANVGLVVDEVLMVGPLSSLETEGQYASLHASPYISGIRKSSQISGMILELNIPEILKSQMNGDA